MVLFTRAILVVAMVILGIVSMWTTYQSLHDSILPAPIVQIQFTESVVWDCSIFALALSVAIGLMLYALKMAIIDGQKRLNLLGLLGLIVVAFISIVFNMDVLYRTANQSFFLNYSISRVKTVYQDYLAESQRSLIERRDGHLRIVARQEGELDAEIKGLRDAPAGYGTAARGEDYQLTLLQRETAVDLETVREALQKKQEADALLATVQPSSLDEVERFQHEIRVLITDLGAVTGQPLPELVRLESPMFAVFRKLFDLRQVGLEEVFFVLLAFLLDLGDIVGYSLVPAAVRKKTRPATTAALPEFLKPENELKTLPPSPGFAPAAEQNSPNQTDEQKKESSRARRPITFRRK